ncbi:MAG: hypothetical protein IKS19_07780 [Clostridia bacterium]|nr:hypothetical protein [Clostridia bacterium]
MKKLIAVFALRLSLYFVVCCDPIFKPNIRSKTKVSADDNRNDEIKPARLIVNGSEIASDYVRINLTKAYAELPVITVAKALGAGTEQQNQSTFLISFPERRFLLDVQNNLLIDLDIDEDIMLGAPGTQHGAYYKTVDGDLIADSDRLILFLHEIGETVKIDFDSLTVIIEPKKG